MTKRSLRFETGQLAKSIRQVGRKTQAFPPQNCKAHARDKTHHSKAPKTIPATMVSQILPEHFPISSDFQTAKAIKAANQNTMVSASNTKTAITGASLGNLSGATSRYMVTTIVHTDTNTMKLTSEGTSPSKESLSNLFATALMRISKSKSRQGNWTGSK